MTKLANHASASVTKMILLGDSGAGKTGALASLADAGYNVRILDLDNGADVLANLLNDPKSPYKKEALGRVDYETITDPMKNVNGKLIPKQAKVWQSAVKLLDNWKTETADFGPISTWTPQDVLVIDSLSILGNASLNFITAMNGRLGQKPYQSDYGDAQALIESLMQMLYDESVRCNIIVNTHITYVGGEGQIERGYPSCVGSKLPQKIGRYFNTILMVKSQGSGASVRRKIITSTVPLVELKNTAPLRVKPEYDLATGLAEYFRDVQGASAPKPVPPVASPPLGK